MDKILLISPPRSGSQLVVTILEDPSVYMLNEIFTFHNYKSQYTGDEEDAKDRPNKYIDFFFSKSDKKIAIAKILISSWPKERLDKILQNNEYKFIFIHRKNLLESAASLAIARQTGQWMADKENYRMPNDFEINIDNAEAVCENLFDSTMYCINNLNKENSIIVTYRDLYSDNTININTVNKIRTFVGLNALDSFESQFVKQNGPKTYSKIINKDELEEKLGYKYGFLGSTDVPQIWGEK